MFNLAIDYDLKAKEAEADEHAESVRIGNSRGKLIGLAAALLKATPRLPN
jgi:hypothetical protein